jgi:DNA-binding response OmpR family regulator
MAESTHTVLIVSDDPHLSSEFAHAFPAGVAVSFARDAREALSSLEEQISSVVIVDMRTGSAGGYGLSSDMRAIEHLSEVPKLFLIERPQDEWLARQGGATAVLVKPIETGELASHALSLVSAAAPS